MNLRHLGIFVAALTLLSPLSASASVYLATPNTTALSNGLIAYWPLDGDTTNWSSGTTADISGNGNTGKLLNLSTTTTPAAGKIGGAFFFNGSTGEIQVPNTTALNPSTVTVSVWIYSTVTDPSLNSERIVDKANQGTISQNGFRMQAFSAANCGSSGPEWGMQWYNGSPQLLCGPATVVGQWVNLVFTYDGTTARFYSNGVLVNSVTTSYTGSNSFNLGIGNSDQVNKPFAGKIDDVRIYNRALSAQEVGLLYALGTIHAGNTATSDSSFSIDQGGLNGGLVAYWPLDGNTTNWTTGTTADVSGNNNTGTLVGMSTTSSPTAGKIGQALKFNGTTSDIPTAYTIPAQSSATSFTWAAWVYVNPAGNSSTVVILGFRNGATWVKITPTAFEYSSGGLISYSIPTGKWLQLAIVKNGTNFTYYQNGAVVGTGSSSGTVVSHTFYMGGDPGFPGDGLFSGMLDDVRIYNRALTSQEVDDLYTAGEVNVDHSNTVSGTGINSGLVGYWTFDGGTINWNAKTIADVSGQSETLTMNGYNAATNTAPVAGKIGQALSFNNSTQDLSHANIPAFNFGTGDFSVSFWMKPASPWGTATTIGLIGQKTGDTFDGWQIYQDSGHPGQLDMRITLTNNFLTNSTIPAGKWTYATFVRQGSNTYWYLNGALDSSGTNSSSISDTGSFYIGFAPTWTAYYPGALDDVRIYNRALSSQEVQQLYQMAR